MPSCQPSANAGSGGRSRAVAFRPALRGPVLDRLNLRCGERAIVDEEARCRIWLPRRHRAAPGHVGDQRHALARVAIGLQAERPISPGAMAGRAMAEDDRGDIARQVTGSAAEAGLASSRTRHNRADQREDVHSESSELS